MCENPGDSTADTYTDRTVKMICSNTLFFKYEKKQQYLFVMGMEIEFG